MIITVPDNLYRNLNSVKHINKYIAWRMSYINDTRK